MNQRKTPKYYQEQILKKKKYCEELKKYPANKATTTQKNTWHKCNSNRGMDSKSFFNDLGRPVATYDTEKTYLVTLREIRKTSPVFKFQSPPL